MHDWIMNGRPEKESVNHYRYRMSLGTDGALTYARNVGCVRIPMNRPSMQAVVDHLNNQNKHDWLVRQPGTLLVSYLIHRQFNTYFQTESPIESFSPLGTVIGTAAQLVAKEYHRSSRVLQNAKVDLRMKDLTSNLIWNQERYKAARESLGPWSAGDSRFQGLYRKYLDEQITRCEVGLQAL